MDISDSAHTSFRSPHGQGSPVQGGLGLSGLESGAGIGSAGLPLSMSQERKQYLIVRPRKDLSGLGSY